MTTKDHIALAEAVEAEVNFRAPSDVGREAVAHVARRIANVLAADNDRFDRARFIDACGLTLPEVLPGFSGADAERIQAKVDAEVARWSS